MPSDIGDVPENSRYWVKSVGRAFDVLDFLATSRVRDGASVTEIAEALGISKSAVFATLFTLKERGAVSDVGSGMGRKYRLGLRLQYFGEVAASSNDLKAVSKPFLEDLARKVGATARLAFLSQGSAVVIEQATGNERVRLDLQVGSAEDLHTTSLGKAILAEIPSERARRIVESVGLEPHTDKTITDVDEFMEHLTEVKRLGYAINDEEDAPGVFGVASPVFGANGICLGAVTITGLIGQHAPGWSYEDMAHEVARTAESISAAMGFRPQP